MTRFQLRGNNSGEGIEIGDGVEECRYLFAMMLFPNNKAQKAQQEQYCKFRELQEINERSRKLKAYREPRPAIGTRGPRKFISDADEDAQFEKIIEFLASPDLIDVLVDPLPTSFADEIARLTTNAVIAGTMLMYIYALSKEDIKTKANRRAEGSQNIAAYICGQHNLGRTQRRPPGRPKTDERRDYPALGEAEAKKHWKEYRAVSHLWAAYIHLVGYKQDLSTIKLSESVDRIKLLKIADYYERFMTKFFSGQGGHSQRERFTPLRIHYSGLINGDISRCSSPRIPAGVLSTVKKWVPEYDTDDK